MCPAAKLAIILVAFPSLKVISSYRISSPCQVADIVHIEPLIVCLRLLLCWGGY